MSGTAVMPHPAPPVESRVDRSVRAFCAHLLREHLEELSFLVEQRRAWATTRLASTERLESLDERIAAHLDGLSTCGSAALTDAAASVAGGDPEEVFGIVGALLAAGELSQAESVVLALEAADTPRLVAAAEAAVWAAPAACEAWASRLLARGDGRTTRVAARIMGLRRAGDVRELERVAGLSEGDVTAFVWALARLPGTKRPALIGGMNAEPPATRRLALMGLLRQGNPADVARAVERVERLPWAALAVAVSAGPAALPRLRAMLDQSLGDRRDVLVALGVLGDVAAVPTLLATQVDGRLEPGAATGLHLITGAGITEPGAEEDDAPPTDGFTVPGLSLDPAAWAAAWQQAVPRLARPGRYRLGKIYRPAEVLAGLLESPVPGVLRELFAREVEIRYGVTVDYEPELPLEAQRRALARAAAQIPGAGGPAVIQTGHWQVVRGAGR